MSKTELYLSKIVKYGLYAILLTPLVFWPRALYGFMAPKFILFQVLVEIVFASWLILQMIDSRNQSVLIGSGNQSYLRRNYIILALSGFIVISFISAFFDVDFSRSFWGIGARMTGLFAEFHFFAWFLVLASSLKNSYNSHQFVYWHRYLNFSFAVSVLVALTAFYTNLDWRLVPGYTIFSNPTFVAPYFLFHFFWGLYQIFIKSNVRNRVSNIKWWFFVIGSILILIALLLGEVRGAIIGLIAGILFLGIGLILSDIFNRRKRIILAVFYLLLLLGIIFFWQWRSASFVQSVGILKKFSEISTSATVQTRLLTWQSALEGFKSAGWQTVFGAGPENLNYVFNAHYNPRLLMFGGGSFAETWQDKPHNAFLEILTEVGLVGSLFYMLIWLAAVFALFKLFKSGQKFLSLTLMAAFISYFGLMFFSFDSFGSWFGLYLMLGFLASQNNSNLQIYSNSTNINQNLKKLFVAFAYISILGLLGVNLSIWRANLADADALRIFSKDPAQGIELFKKSVNYSSPYKAEYQFDLAASVAGAVEKGISLPDLEDTINFMLEEADKATASHPNDAAKYTDMIRIYNILGTKGRDPEILARAEVFGKKSLELSPRRQETLYYLARTALLKNDAKTAIIWAKQAVSAEPSIKQSHWYLGLAYVANNQRQEGIAEIKKALELGYQPQNAAEEAFIKNVGL